MKLVQIFHKLGKQPLYITNHTDAKVFVGDREYMITGIKYNNGKSLGFNAIPIDNSTCKNNKVEFSKLVRDRIPEIMLSEGDIPCYFYLSDKDYINELKRKLKEEVQEYIKDERKIEEEQFYD